MKKTLLASTALVAAGLVVGTVNQAVAQTVYRGPGTAPVSTQNLSPPGATPAAGTPRFVLRIAGRYLFYVGAVWQDDRGGGANLLPVGRVPGTAETANVDQLSDSRIHFDAAINLDNGITAGWFIRWEIRGVNTANGNQFPRNYGYLASDRLGQLRIGSQIAAMGEMSMAPAPGVWQGRTAGFLDGSRAWAYFTLNPAGGAGTSGLFNGIGDTFISNNNGVGYYTPRIEGFQAGVTWFAELTSHRESQNQLPTVEGNQATYRNVVSVSVNFDRTFEGFRIQASGGYSWAQNPRYIFAASGNGATATSFFAFDRTPYIWQAGGRVGYAGFMVGGGYMRMANWRQSSGGNPTAAVSWTGGGIGAAASNLGPAALDGDVFIVGASYAWGPWAVSLEYTQARYSDCPHLVAEQQGAGAGLVCGRDRLSALALVGSYQLGPGVFWDAAIFHTRIRGNSWNNGNGSSITVANQFAQNNRATGFITGLTFNF